MASDGHSLRLYQAVIEAKKLLSELSNPEISVSLSVMLLIFRLIISLVLAMDDLVKKLCHSKKTKTKGNETMTHKLSSSNPSSSRQQKRIKLIAFRNALSGGAYK